MGPARVLVVDDEPGVRELFTRVLQYRGYEVKVARDAVEALYALERGRSFDVVLVDLIMPRIDGLEMIGEMRSMAPTLRFVVVSGKLLSSDERAALAASGIRYHSKPFRNDEVLRTLESMVQEPSRQSGCHEKNEHQGHSSRA